MLRCSKGGRELTRQKAEPLIAAEYAEEPTLQLHPDFTDCESETPAI